MDSISIFYKKKIDFLVFLECKENDSTILVVRLYRDLIALDDNFRRNLMFTKTYDALMTSIDIHTNRKVSRFVIECCFNLIMISHINQELLWNTWFPKRLEKLIYENNKTSKSSIIALIHSLTRKKKEKQRLLIGSPFLYYLLQFYHNEKKKKISWFTILVNRLISEDFLSVLISNSFGFPKAFNITRLLFLQIYKNKSKIKTKKELFNIGKTIEILLQTCQNIKKSFFIKWKPNFSCLLCNCRGKKISVFLQINSFINLHCTNLKEHLFFFFKLLFNGMNELIKCIKRKKNLRVLRRVQTKINKPNNFEIKLQLECFRCILKSIKYISLKIQHESSILKGLEKTELFPFCLTLLGILDVKKIFNLSKIKSYDLIEGKILCKVKNSKKNTYSLKCIILKVIANTVFKIKKNQNKINELGGIFTILRQYKNDKYNPFLQEWIFFSIRNLSENNFKDLTTIESFNFKKKIIKRIKKVNNFFFQKFTRKSTKINQKI